MLAFIQKLRSTYWFVFIILLLTKRVLMWHILNSR
jgi:hypothetical protein